MCVHGRCPAAEGRAARGTLPVDEELLERQEAPAGTAVEGDLHVVRPDRHPHDASVVDGLLVARLRLGSGDGPAPDASLGSRRGAHSRRDIASDRGPAHPTTTSGELSTHEGTVWVPRDQPFVPSSSPRSGSQNSSSRRPSARASPRRRGETGTSPESPEASAASRSARRATPRRVHAPREAPRRRPRAGALGIGPERRAEQAGTWPGQRPPPRR